MANPVRAVCDINTTDVSRKRHHLRDVMMFGIEIERIPESLVNHPKT